MKLRSPTGLAAIGVAATLVLALGVVIALLRTDGARAVSENAALIGALVALGGVFTAQMVSITLDNRRAQESREIEAQRARETALQNYFEQIGKLITDHNLRSTQEDDVRELARGQTLTVMRNLDAGGKRSLMRFLHGAGLIKVAKPTITLADANLKGADLRKANLGRADLSEALMENANLSGAYLRGGSLKDADLSGANLSEAIGITNDELDQQTIFLHGATMPNGQKYEDWRKSRSENGY